MKKTLVTMALILVALNVSAQYKKVSFFTKEGRTYGIGTSFLMMGDGNGSPLSIDFTFGKDGDSKFFSFSELKIIPGHKFSYTTTALTYSNKTTSYEVNEKTGLMVNYWMNLGYYFIKPSEKAKLQPYVTAGAGILGGGGEKDSDDGTAYNALVKGMLRLDKTPTEGIITVGLRGSVGCLYNFTPSVALKVDAGYSYAFLKSYDEATQFATYVNHPYVGVGVRFKMLGKE